jgi:hypothetical protein
MSELAGEGRRDRHVGRPTVFERHRVHGAGDVGVAPIRREYGSANENLSDRTRERRDPASARSQAINLREFVAYSVDVEAQSRERGRCP